MNTAPKGNHSDFFLKKFTFRHGMNTKLRAIDRLDYISILLHQSQRKIAFHSLFFMDLRIRSRSI